MIHLYVVSMKAPAGPLWFAGSEHGLFLLEFGKMPDLGDVGSLSRVGLVSIHRHAGPLGAAARSLRDYLSGRPGTPEANLDFGAASAFQQRVWRAVRKIPPGHVHSFDKVARAVGSPKGARAVGRALAANPVPLFIPCHRVVTKEGELAGYIGGRNWKRHLLELETAQLRLPATRRRRRARGR